MASAQTKSELNDSLIFLIAKSLDKKVNQAEKREKKK